MRPDETGRYSWLYEGEDAIYDVGIKHNPDTVDVYVSSGTYHLFVVVNMQPVEFGLIPVDEGSETPFVATDDISDDLPTQTRATIELPVDEPVGFTFVIPSDAFQVGNAHDVRMVLVSDESPKEQPAEVHSSHVIERANCVYYGGRDTPELSRQLDVNYIRPPSPVEFYTRLTGGFLYPDESTYSLEDITTRDDLNLGQKVRASTSSPTLQGLIVSSTSESAEKKYVRVLKDGRFLEEPQGLVDVPPLATSSRNAASYAAHYTFEATLTDSQIHEYQVLIFDSPLGDDPFRYGVSDVNTLFVEYQNR